MLAVGLDDGFAIQVALAEREAPFADRRDQRLIERTLHIRERYEILWSLGAGQGRLDRTHVQFDGIGEHRIGRTVHSEHALFLVVALDEIDSILRSPGKGEVVQSLIIDREEADGGAVLRRHVGQCGTVRQAQGG